MRSLYVNDDGSASQLRQRRYALLLPHSDVKIYLRDE